MTDDLTGWFSYRDTATLQHADVGQAFTRLFDETRPARVVEIGTCAGGLTLLVRDLLDQAGLTSCDLRSYDVADMHRPALRAAIAAGARIDFRRENLFNETYDALVAPAAIGGYIRESGPTIVLCDGANKKNEFRMFAPLLKTGDVIMAHDYAPDHDYFQRHLVGTVWNWHEIADADVADVVTACDLRPMLQQEFRAVVWLCTRRA